MYLPKKIVLISIQGAALSVELLPAFLGWCDLACPINLYVIKHGHIVNNDELKQYMEYPWSWALISQVLCIWQIPLGLFEFFRNYFWKMYCTYWLLLLTVIMNNQKLIIKVPGTLILLQPAWYWVNRVRAFPSPVRILKQNLEIYQNLGSGGLRSSYTSTLDLKSMYSPS